MKKRTENACFENIESNREKFNQAYKKYPEPPRYEKDEKKRTQR